MKVEEKKSESSQKDLKETKEVKETKDADTLTFDDVKENVKSIEKGIQQKENRYLIRVMRTIFSIRKRLNDSILKRVLNNYYTTQNAQVDKEFLLSFIDTQSSVAVIFYFFFSNFSKFLN